MDEPEVKKLCRICGEDLRHKERHKSRDGTYLCPNCVGIEEKRLGRRLEDRLTARDVRRYVLYAVLAVIACIAFWIILDFMHRVDIPSL